MSRARNASAARAQTPHPAKPPCRLSPAPVAPRPHAAPRSAPLRHSPPANRVARPSHCADNVWPPLLYPSGSLAFASPQPAKLARQAPSQLPPSPSFLFLAVVHRPLPPSPLAIAPPQPFPARAKLPPELVARACNLPHRHPIESELTHPRTPCPRRAPPLTAYPATSSTVTQWSTACPPPPLRPPTAVGIPDSGEPRLRPTPGSIVDRLAGTVHRAC